MSTTKGDSGTEWSDDRLSIGDFARRTGLTVSALRFYAGRGVFDPAEVDPLSGYRRYAGAQIEAGRLLRDLRRIGMPLDDIREALAGSRAHRRELVDRHLARLEHDARRAHRIAQTLGAAPNEQRTEWNPMTSDTATTSVGLAADELVAALDQVLAAAATDGTRPHLMTVLVEYRQGSLRLVATDGHRLAVRDLATDGASGDSTDPAPSAPSAPPARLVLAAEELRAWPAALTPHGPVEGAADIELAIDADGLRVERGAEVLAARPVPVRFPDYEPYLESRTDDVTAVVDRNELLSTLDGLGPAGEVVCTVDTAGHLTVAGAGGTTGGEHSAASTTLNLGYVIDAVRGAVGPEVVIEIGRADRSGRVPFRRPRHLHLPDHAHPERMMAAVADSPAYRWYSVAVHRHHALADDVARLEQLHRRHRVLQGEPGADVGLDRPPMPPGRRPRCGS